MTRGHDARVDIALLVAAARTAAADISLDAGVAVIPLHALAGSAFDLRMPLVVAVSRQDSHGGAAREELDDRSRTEELPGRRGAGWALLARLYGAGHVVRALPGGERIALERLFADADLPGGAIGVIVPPLPPLEALASPWAMPWLSARLRAPDGCPWDREQTHGSLAKHLIEEAWELHDAIEAVEAAPPDRRASALDALQGELGDVLLQVILHAQLAAETGAFDLIDVQERLARKIVRRHPHVFGDAVAETSRDVQRNWEATKAAERERVGATSALDGVSRSLPALAASRELQDRASALGFDWPVVGDLFGKLDEEVGELVEALAAAGDPDLLVGRGASGPAALAAAKDELGDVITVLVNLGRRSGIDAEAALRGANDKFRRRFGEVERRAAARAIDLKSADFAVLDGLWNEAKAVERGEGG